MGLLNAVFAAESAAGEVRERAGRLARLGPLAISLVKQSLDASSSLSFADALDQEAVYQGACTGSRDFAEGIAATFERREPDLGLLNPLRPIVEAREGASRQSFGARQGIRCGAVESCCRAE